MLDFLHSKGSFIPRYCEEFVYSPRSLWDLFPSGLLLLGFGLMHRSDGGSMVDYI